MLDTSVLGFPSFYEHKYSQGKTGIYVSESQYVLRRQDLHQRRRKINMWDISVLGVPPMNIIIPQARLTPYETRFYVGKTYIKGGER